MCEPEARIVSFQVKIYLAFQFLEIQGEIVSLEPIFDREFGMHESPLYVNCSVLSLS